MMMCSSIIFIITVDDNPESEIFISKNYIAPWYFGALMEMLLMRCTRQLTINVSIHLK